MSALYESYKTIEENRNFTVYKHTSPNGKVYIGITGKDTKKRWGKDGKGYIDNKHFMNAIKKYGWNNIKHEILFSEFTEEEAKLMEQCLIALYESMNPQKGYNKTLGGDGTLGYKASKKTREKLSESLKKTYAENPQYREHLRKIHLGSNNHMYGKTVSKDTRKKIGEKSKKAWENHEYRENLQKKRLEQWKNQERRKLQSEVSKKLWKNQERRKLQSEVSKKLWENQEYRNMMLQKSKEAKQKKVICLTTNKVFNSINEAGKYYNIKSFSHIGGCCRGERKYCGEYKDGIRLVWMYYDEYLKYDNKNIQRKIQDAYKPQEPWNKGKTNIYTNETKNKIGEATKKLWENQEYRNKMSKTLGKKIICITTGEIFNSILEGSKFYGLKSPSGIQKVCNNQGSQKTAGKLSDGTKLKWMYYEDYLKAKEEK